MKKSNVKGIVICIASLVVLALVTINVFGTKAYAATTSVNEILNNINNTQTNQIKDDPNDITETNTNKNSNVNTNTNANSNTNSNSNANSNANANSNTNTGIPYTGVDNSVIFVIVAFGVSALIAYKKIRDYKNI